MIEHRETGEKIDKKATTAAGSESLPDGQDDQVGHAMILRDITQSRAPRSKRLSRSD